MLRLTFWTLVGFVGCLYAFGGDLTADERAAIEARRADRVSVMAAFRDAFDDGDGRRQGGYVPTLAELDAMGQRNQTPTTTTPQDTVQLASLDAPQNDALLATTVGAAVTDHAVTTATDPEKLAELAALDGSAQDSAPSAEALATETTDDMILRVVSANRVNVRAGPSTGYGVVGQVLKADIVRVVSNPYSEWVKILVEGDGVEGYMAARFLKEMTD
ncbi:SH3 domain-containing protein [Celeribacter sp.]|uniref:SH3 domain-containing protein n=1 Tax=Celeribacter sp. TaxID=1890673 RepID=UPI003A95017F